MATYGNVTFKGNSGKSYDTTVYLLNQEFNAVGAVYMIVKRYVDINNSHRFKPIYVGITGDISTRFNDHHKEGCFTKAGANFICIHRDDNESSRRAKETDLLATYDWPCNG